MTDPQERFAALYDEHYPAIVRYAARRTDPEQARDIAMDTFLVVWRRLDEVPPEALPWLYGVARNVLANEQRGARRRSSLLGRLYRDPAPVAAPDHALATVETLRIRQAMATLSPTDQETLQLVAWEELDVAAAAQVVGCTPRTFATRLRRARVRLQAALNPDATPSAAIEGSRT